MNTTELFPAVSRYDLFYDISYTIDYKVGRFFKSKGVKYIPFVLPMDETIGALANSKLENNRLGSDIVIESDRFTQKGIFEYIIIGKDGTVKYKLLDEDEERVVGKIDFRSDFRWIVSKQVTLIMERIFNRSYKMLGELISTFEGYYETSVYYPPEKVRKNLLKDYVSFILDDKKLFAEVFRALFRADRNLLAKTFKKLGDVIVIGPYKLSKSDITFYVYPLDNKIGFGGKYKKLGLVDAEPDEFREALLSAGVIQKSLQEQYRGFPERMLKFAGEL